MPKRRVKKVAGKREPKLVKKMDFFERLRKSLAKNTKEKLVDTLVELAREDRNLFRQLDARFKLETPPEEIAVTIHLAIADATYFDERDRNRNFDYDYAAYEAVKRNLSRLVELGQLPLAMELSLELMKHGSCQAEASDETLMARDIEECLAVVVEGIKESDLLPTHVIAWCDKMLKADRIGCIYYEELQALRSHAEALRP